MAMRYHTRNTLSALKDRVYKAAEAADQRGDTDAAEFLEEIADKFHDYLMDDPTYVSAWNREHVRFQHDGQEAS